MVITIRDKIVQRGRKKMGVSQLCRLIAQHTISDMSDKPIPDNVRWLCESGKHAVYIIELQPELRSILWTDYPHNEWYEEDDAVAGTYTVATPYVILKVPFYKSRILGDVEVFYRNQPLQSIDDELYHTNLHNVKQFYSSKGYLCCDGLTVSPGLDRAEVLGELVNHLWSGEFNLELGQNFENFANSGHDKRLATIDAWQAASLADPKFVLGVKWLHANVTVRDLIEIHFRNQAIGVSPASSSQLGNLILSASYLSAS